MRHPCFPCSCCWLPPTCAPSRTTSAACSNRAANCATSSRTSSACSRPNRNGRRSPSMARPCGWSAPSMISGRRCTCRCSTSSGRPPRHSWPSTSSFPGTIRCCATMRRVRWPASPVIIRAPHRRTKHCWPRSRTSCPPALNWRVSMPKTSVIAMRWHCSVQSRPVSTATIRPPQVCAHAWTAIWTRCRHAGAGRVRSPPGLHGATTSTAVRPAAPACSVSATPA